MHFTRVTTKNGPIADTTPLNTSQLFDKYGRHIVNLRVSLTDRCNFRCMYCMPEEGIQWMHRSELLTFEEIIRLITIFTDLGIEKIRLTGGEPLIRKDVGKLIKDIIAIPKIRSTGLTTNGYFLEEKAQELAEAGLKRLNVSIDSLERERFNRIVRRDVFDKVIRGLQRAVQLSIGKIKVNVVVIKGTNDDEIEAFALFARENPIIVRFIEFMPLGAQDDWGKNKVVPSQEVLRRVNAVSPIVPVNEDGKHPAKYYRFIDGSGEIGVISSVSEPFCDQCNRIRLTPDGQLRTCLFSLNETDLKAVLRGGASDENVKTVIKNAVWDKEPGHLINSPYFQRPARTMSQIGG